LISGLVSGLVSIFALMGFRVGSGLLADGRLTPVPPAFFTVAFLAGFLGVVFCAMDGGPVGGTQTHAQGCALSPENAESYLYIDPL
jgi:hypothetical protein